MNSSNAKPVGWRAVIITLLCGLAIYAVSLAIALALSEGTGDRFIPVFRVGQLIGQFVLFIGILGCMIGATLELFRFVKRFRPK